MMMRRTVIVPRSAESSAHGGSKESPHERTERISRPGGRWRDDRCGGQSQACSECNSDPLPEIRANCAQRMPSPRSLASSLFPREAMFNRLWRSPKLISSILRLRARAPR
jgi:hypothetical protein